MYKDMEWSEWDTIKLGLVVGFIYPFLMEWLYKRDKDKENE